MMGMNLKKFYLKHLLYILTIDCFTFEILLVMICGLSRATNLFFILFNEIEINLKNKYDLPVKNIERNFEFCILGFESLICNMLGIIQLINRMSIWNYKKKIKSKYLYNLECINYFLQLIFNFIFYYFFNSKISVVNKK